MKYHLKIYANAFKETDDAFNYYEDQSPGLGERFLKSLEDAYFKLSLSPQYYGFIHFDENIRDMKISTFPFVIILKL